MTRPPSTIIVYFSRRGTRLAHLPRGPISRRRHGGVGRVPRDSGRYGRLRRDLSALRARWHCSRAPTHAVRRAHLSHSPEAAGLLTRVVRAPSGARSTDTLPHASSPASRAEGIIRTIIMLITAAYLPVSGVRHHSLPRPCPQLFGAHQGLAARGCAADRVWTPSRQSIRVRWRRNWPLRARPLPSEGARLTSLPSAPRRRWWLVV